MPQRFRTLMLVVVTALAIIATTGAIFLNSGLGHRAIPVSGAGWDGGSSSPQGAGWDTPRL